MKRFNTNTGAADVFEFHGQQQAKEQQAENPAPAFAPLDEFMDMKDTINNLKDEIERLKKPTSGGKAGKRMMPPMNNPMMAMLQMARNGGNPMQMLQQMAGQNPQAAQAMRLIQGKNPQQLRQTAENMAKQRGTSVEEIARQLGIPMK